MPLGFGSEVADQERDDDAADHGREDNVGPPAARRREHVGVVGESEATCEEHIVQDVDQVSKQQGAKTRHHAQSKCEQGQTQKAERLGFVLKDCSDDGRVGRIVGLTAHDGFRFGDLQRLRSLRR